MKPQPPIDATPAILDDDFGGDTKAHYMPNDPRPPASSHDEPRPSASSRDEIAEIAALLAPAELHDVRLDPVLEVAPTPAEAPQLLQLPQLPIAEMFQEMLWRAYRAGALSSTPTYEAFARWYELAVLG